MAAAACLAQNGAGHTVAGLWQTMLIRNARPADGSGQGLF
jgi:hypothetical protein